MSYALLLGFYDDADVVKFTAAADVSDGDVVVVQGRVGVVTQEDVASGDEGLMIVGTDVRGIKMPKANGAINKHAKLYWDEDGNPLGGVAGSGAVTTTSTANLYIGRAAQPAASGDEMVAVELTNE